MPSTNPPDGDIYFNVRGVASVRWDPIGSMVYEKWEGWADSDEFENILNGGLQALTDHHGSLWLADCRRQRVLKASDQEWGDNVWLPSAVAAGLKRFAIVLPESGLATMNLRVREERWRAKGLEVGYFASVPEAVDWLAS